MNNKHRRTLVAVFRYPISGTIAWTDIETLLISVGADVIEGSGSRVRSNYSGEIATFHRPLLAKEAKRYQVKAARIFLTAMGVKP